MPRDRTEEIRLQQSADRIENWQRWGPYLSERQWGTVREDYSTNQDAWRYFPHDHARSRAYRWGEDGLLGITDRECRLCFSFAFWNTQDPILKERLFGLTGPEGNHGEDVKECYYYLDSTPTHSYMKGLYKYPQAAFPYVSLVEQNARRSIHDLEFELIDSGLFDDNRYFDCEIEYAKNSPNDLLMRVTIHNRGSEPAPLTVLSQWWYRNTWSWGCVHEGCTPKPSMRRGAELVEGFHHTLGHWFLASESAPDGTDVGQWFTDNESNPKLHPEHSTLGKYWKDAFHRRLIQGETDAVNSKCIGTKYANVTEHIIAPGQPVQLRCRMAVDSEAPAVWFGEEFDAIFDARRREANAFYAEKIPTNCSIQETRIARQAYAGLLWTKQFYHYSVRDWIHGDENFGQNIPGRENGRNSDWEHLFNRDVISMPDKWEYPWYAAWDLAFHMLPMANIDLPFAKDQLLLFLREWYMHPNGALPAYEWALSDVNPPVHAWACWNVYLSSQQQGVVDPSFLERTFQKLLLNFTWWVNRKDPNGRHIFSGGFLGLDNIGVFDRSKPLPGGGVLRQADATAWMAFFCGYMLRIALELAEAHNAYADMASKFLEHYLSIAEAMNAMHGTGLWDDEDGFYYDHLDSHGRCIPMKVRSLVGLIPLCAPVLLSEDKINSLPGFHKRTEWFLNHRGEMAEHMSLMSRLGPSGGKQGLRLLALPNEVRLKRLLHLLLDEKEFLSPFGIRSLSAAHASQPFQFESDGYRAEVGYVPGESDSHMFGGNSNWRGPIWFPINYLIIESLRTYYDFYQESLRVECPTGSNHWMTLGEVADELERRLTRIFLPDASGRRPCHGTDMRYATDPAWKDLVLFYEYFHGDNARGLGASHQTGWTALVASMLTGRN